MKNQIILFISIILFTSLFFFSCEEKIDDTADMVVVKENDVQLFESPGSAKQMATVKAFSYLSCLNPNSPVVKKATDSSEVSWYKLETDKGVQGWTVAENLLFRESPEQNMIMIRTSLSLYESCSFQSKHLGRGAMYDQFTYLGFKYKEQGEKKYDMALVKNVADVIGWTFSGGYEYNSKLGVAIQEINLYKNPVVEYSDDRKSIDAMEKVIVSLDPVNKKNFLKIIEPDAERYSKNIYYIEEKLNGTDVLTFKEFDIECIRQLHPIYKDVKKDVEKILKIYDSIDYMEGMKALKNKEDLVKQFEKKIEAMETDLKRYNSSNTIFYTTFSEFLNDFKQANKYLKESLSTSGESTTIMEADVYDSGVVDSEVINSD